jgi:hypothetical protein
MNKGVRIATGWNMHPPVSAIQAHPQFSVSVMADFVDDVAVSFFWFTWIVFGS